MLLSSKTIASLCAGERPLLSPFFPHKVRDGAISYGLSDAGYDIRLAPRLSEIVPAPHILDPKRGYSEGDLAPLALHHGPRGSFFLLSPGAYVIGESMEHFDMPLDVSGTCLTKSTYARVGITCNITPLEPGWNGILTLEIANLSSRYVCVYAEEGIAQILFNRLDQPSDGYHGGYQGAKGAEGPKVPLPGTHVHPALLPPHLTGGGGREVAVAAEVVPEPFSGPLMQEDREDEGVGLS